MINLTYLMDHILYHQKHETVTDNSPIKLYVNKTENRVTCKTKTGYYLECLSLKRWNYLEAIKII